MLLTEADGANGTVCAAVYTASNAFDAAAGQNLSYKAAPAAAATALNGHSKSLRQR
jgi:hypothetical protein